jgi:hypothetical protein
MAGDRSPLEARSHLLGTPLADPPTGPDANSCDRLLEGVDERDLAGGADHRRGRVDLDHRQPAASLGNRVPSRVCAFSLTRCVSICFCQVSRSTIGGVSVMLVSFDACQVTSRMSTAGPRSGPRDQGEAGKPPGRYPHEACRSASQARSAWFSVSAIAWP